MAGLAVHAGIGSSGEPESVLAQKLVDRVWELNREVGIPETTDLIKAEDIEELVDVALAEGSGYPTPRFFDREECRAVLQRLSAA
jgi:alcohol dehydrogenase class IV